VSEELRVLYVAMTRARDRLIMTYASQYLQKDIRDIALTMDLSGQTVMTAEVTCPGKWILYSALKRTEAGALFAIGGRPEQTRIAERPWKIVADEAPSVIPSAMNHAKQGKDEEMLDMEYLHSLLDFQYRHEAATRTPSKQTATQIKGRLKDREAAQLAEEPRPVWRNWRSASFHAVQMDGAAFGNAVHTVMQHIHYDACASLEGVQGEIDRLISAGFIAPEQGRLIDCEKIAGFFASDFGRKLCSSSQVLREFKFSILDDASRYGDDLTGERVLLQGVVDCAIVEEDGISLVDFKTDRITKKTVEEIRQRYASQIETYASALSRIFQKPVKSKALYLYSVGEFLDLP
jgi:ATP-dependent helicase/nuclease subunit A